MAKYQTDLTHFDENEKLHRINAYHTKLYTGINQQTTLSIAVRALSPNSFTEALNIVKS